MEAPSTFKLTDLLQKFDKCFGATGRNYGKVTGDRTFEDIEKRRKDRWNFLFIAGMWFQDLFNYDFRRTEQCIIPYATQEGEISFCAYNTGVGWRNIVEKMHMTATLTKWYEEKGRHEIIAGGKSVNLPSKEHSLILNHGSGERRHPARSGRQGHRQDRARREDPQAQCRHGEEGCRRRAHGQALSRSDPQGKADRSRLRAGRNAGD